MKTFEIPTVFDEIGREPIEEFLMGRGRSGAAKIVGVPGDRFAEVILPDAIDDGAGSERVFGMGDPFSKSQATSLECVGNDRSI